MDIDELIPAAVLNRVNVGNDFRFTANRLGQGPSQILEHRHKFEMILRSSWFFYLLSDARGKSFYINCAGDDLAKGLFQPEFPVNAGDRRIGVFFRHHKRHRAIGGALRDGENVHRDAVERTEDRSYNAGN